MTRTLKLVALGAVLLALTACGSSKPAAVEPQIKTITVEGYMDLNIPHQWSAHDAGSPCDASLSQGYSDMAQGAQVTIYDAAGKVLTLGALDAGTIATDTDPVFGICRFAFQVPGVPNIAGPFQIQVSHRGMVAFTKDQALNVALSLGQ
jgi:hypothetical protein